MLFTGKDSQCKVTRAIAEGDTIGREVEDNAKALGSSGFSNLPFHTSRQSSANLEFVEAVLSLSFQAQVDAVLGLLWQIEAFIYSFGGSRWVQGLVSA